MKKAKQFTLIELMVALAIIAILASLLIPSLGRARKTARIAVCAGNLGQIGTAIYTYSSDNKFHLPGHFANSTVELTWDDHLGMGYDGRKLTYEQAKGSNPGETGVELYQCPLDMTYITNAENSGTTSAYAKARNRSYSANQGKLDGSKSSKLGWLAEGSGESLKTTKIKNPSNSLMLFEYHRYKNRIGNHHSGVIRAEQIQTQIINKGIDWSHDKYKSNYLLIDGSVRQLNFITTYSGTSKDPWTNPDETDTMWDCQ